MISNEKLFRIAVAYYVDKRSQQDIADEHGVSHVQIGKYLKLAKDRGIVEISINPPFIEADEKNRYERVLKSSYGLENLVLVPGAHSEKNSFQFLIDGATDYLLSEFPNQNIRIGVGQGRTMNALSLSKVRTVDKRTQWKIIPVCNYTLSKESEGENNFFSYRRMVENFSSAWGTSMMGCNMTSDVDVLVAGVGVPFSREPNVREVAFGKAAASKIGGRDILGDYLNCFFDSDGNIYHLAERSDSFMEWKQIKKVPRRIAIASGSQKISSISGLLKCNAVDTLITDLPTIKAVVENII